MVRVVEREQWRVFSLTSTIASLVVNLSRRRMSSLIILSVVLVLVGTVRVLSNSVLDFFRELTRYFRVRVPLKFLGRIEAGAPILQSTYRVTDVTRC